MKWYSKYMKLIKDNRYEKQKWRDQVMQILGDILTRLNRLESEKKKQWPDDIKKGEVYDK